MPYLGLFLPITMKIRMLGSNEIREVTLSVARDLIGDKKARACREKRRTQDDFGRKRRGYNHRQLRASRREYRTKSF